MNGRLLNVGFDMRNGRLLNFGCDLMNGRFALELEPSYAICSSIRLERELALSQSNQTVKR